MNSHRTSEEAFSRWAGYQSKDELDSEKTTEDMIEGNEEVTVCFVYFIYRLYTE